VISQEYHEDGNRHLHAYIQFKDKLNIKCPKHFDFKWTDPSTGIEDDFHCNLQTTKKRSNWIKYIKKDGNFKDSEVDHFDLEDYPMGKKQAAFNDNEFIQQERFLSQREPIDWSVVTITSKDGTKHQMKEPDPANKKRHWWIVSAPNAGKSRWVENTFRNKKVFMRERNTYPYEGYRDEKVIIMDDSVPKFIEIAAVANTYGTSKPVYGDTRYTRKYWKQGTTRTMIVLTNLHPRQCFTETLDAVMSRFIVIQDPNLQLTHPLSQRDLINIAEEDPGLIRTEPDIYDTGYLQTTGMRLDLYETEEERADRSRANLTFLNTPKSASTYKWTNPLCIDKVSQAEVDSIHRDNPITTSFKLINERNVWKPPRLVRQNAYTSEQDFSRPSLRILSNENINT